MSDWHDDEDFEDDWVPQAPGEGVRVVGEPGAEPPRDAPRPGGRFPLPGDEGASWSASGEPPRGPDDSTGGGVRLPHWTEPPTGEVPRVLGGDTADDDFETWSQVAGPRFRTGDADWAEGDWGEGELFKDETMGVGALSEPTDERYGDDFESPPPRRGRPRRDRGARAEGPSGPGSLEGPPSHDYPEVHEDEDIVDVVPRLVTAGIVGAIALVAFAAGRPVAMVLVTLIVGVCAFELYTALQRAGYHPATVIGLLGCVAIVPVAYNEGEAAFPLITMLVIGFTFLWYLVEVVHARPTVNIGLTLLPFGWIGIFGAFAGLLLAPDPGGTGLLLGVVICAVGSDVVGYFAGRALGRTPLLPRISPHKTLEGAVAGGLAAVVLGGLVGSALHPWADQGVGAGIMLGLLVAVMAPLGDLVESMIKRDLGVKDLGTFLPGHGGFLDRFDAILFCLPAAYYWVFHLFTT